MAATVMLESLVLDLTVLCQRAPDDAGRPVRDDRYGRMLALCYTALPGTTMIPGVSVNAQLVEAGLAMAYRRYSKMFVSIENGARIVRESRLGGRL